LDNEDFSKTKNELVGKGDLYNILLGAAINDGIDSYPIFDWTQSLLDLSDEIYDFEETNLREEILAYYNEEIYNPNIFYINRLELLPTYRGYGLGKKVIKDIVRRFSGACGLFVLKAFPLQNTATAKRTNDLDEWNKKMAFHKLEQDGEKAIYKMYSYYQSLGFTNILKNDYFFFNPLFKNERLDNISFD